MLKFLTLSSGRLRAATRDCRVELAPTGKYNSIAQCCRIEGRQAGGKIGYQRPDGATHRAEHEQPAGAESIG